MSNPNCKWIVNSAWRKAKVNQKSVTFFLYHPNCYDKIEVGPPPKIDPNAEYHTGDTRRWKLTDKGFKWIK
jgi:hypothetical protein